MDPREPFDARLVGLRCTACDGAIPPDGIRPVAEREDLAFIELRCPHCHTRTIGLLTPVHDGRHAVQLDLARYGEFDPTDEVRLAGGRTLESGDVEAMRGFLAGWRGDVRSLLETPRSGQPWHPGQSGRNDGSIDRATPPR